MPDSLLTFRQYQLQAGSTAIYPREHAIVYPAIGLANEVGEVLSIVKKMMRGDYTAEALREPGDLRSKLVNEIGDAQWYLAQLCTDLDISLPLVAQVNLAKLESRAQRGVLRGEGGQR